MGVMEFEFEELEKATDNFNPKMLVGKGSHGLVYKGILKLHNNEYLHVAIKKPSQALQSLNDDSKLHNEIRLLSSLPQNPHLLALLGTSRDVLNNHNLLVTRLMPNGSLHDCLHEPTTQPPLAWPKRVETALRVARAIQFLHERNPVVIHRDVKSTNVLFDSHWNAKLADFGLAVFQRDDVSLSPPAGTMGYLDPSYTNPSKLSTKNDIFSFGVLLLEIVSGRKAIDMDKTPSSIVEWAVPLMTRQVFDEMRDRRIAFPPCMGRTIARIVAVAGRCVAAKEDERPAIGEVVKEMEGCVVERVRFGIWRSVVRSVGRLRKRRKVGKVIGVNVDHHHKSKGDQKVLLKQLLGDVM